MSVSISRRLVLSGIACAMLGVIGCSSGGGDSSPTLSGPRFSTADAAAVTAMTTAQDQGVAEMIAAIDLAIRTNNDESDANTEETTPAGLGSSTTYVNESGSINRTADLNGDLTDDATVVGTYRAVGSVQDLDIDVDTTVTTTTAVVFPEGTVASGSAMDMDYQTTMRITASDWLTEVTGVSTLRNWDLTTSSGQVVVGGTIESWVELEFIFPTSNLTEIDMTGTYTPTGGPTVAIELYGSASVTPGDEPDAGDVTWYARIDGGTVFGPFTTAGLVTTIQAPTGNN